MMLALLAAAPRLTGVSLVLAQLALPTLLAGAVCSSFPLWKSATLSPDSIERRTYWTGTVVGLVLLFVACAPNWRLAVFSVLFLGVSLVLLATMRTNHVKINGRIYALDASHRAPDRPPALAKTDNEH